MKEEMAGNYYEKEALASKLNSLTSLVEALKDRNVALKTLSKFSKDASKKKRNNGKLLKAEKIVKTRDTVISENRKDSGDDNSNHFEKLIDSSERLSQLAKETWRAKKSSSDLNKLNFDNGESNFLSRKYLKESPSIHVKARESLHKKFKGKREKSNRICENSESDDSNSKIIEKSDVHELKYNKLSLSLDASSDRLSFLAKNTWKMAQMKRNVKPYKEKLAVTASNFENSEKQMTFKYKLKKSRKQRYRVNRMKDEFIVNKLKDKESIPDKSSTNERLSKLAKVIWRDKNCQFLSHQKFRKYRFHSIMDIKMRKFGPHVVNRSSDSTAWENWSRTDSFLQRRRHVTLKQNKFHFVKISSLRFQNKKMQEICPANLKTYSSASKKYHFSRNNFILRRQAYLSGNLGCKEKSWRPSDVSSVHVLNKTKNSLHPVHKKGTKNVHVVFKVKGRKFQTDIKGRRLRRISSSSKALAESVSKPGEAALCCSSTPRKITNHRSQYKYIKRQQSVQSNMASVIASRVVKKSVERLHRNKIRKLVKKQYCMFYNRFGKCKNGDKCLYKHDPEKIAVCTRFLRGTCKEENCFFSHKIDRQKMPTCSFFLRGMCHNDNCPYAHVKVNVNAGVCKDFTKGHCPNGDKCLKKHVLECTRFIDTGKCPDEENCKFYHPKKISRKRYSLSDARVPRPFFKRQHLLSANNETKESTDPHKDSDIQIKPTFAMISHNPHKPELSSFYRKRKRTFDWKKDAEESTNG